MFWISKYVRTHRARYFFAEIMEQRFDIHVVFRIDLQKQASKERFRGTQLETMKSSDSFFFNYDNLLHCMNQSVRLFFNDVLRFQRNVTKARCVSLTAKATSTTPRSKPNIQVIRGDPNGVYLIGGILLT